MPLRPGLQDYAGAGHMLHAAPGLSSSCLMLTWQWPRAGCPDRPDGGAGGAASPSDALELRQLADYLSYVLQWEGDGSLVAALKRRGWAAQVEAYCDECSFTRNDAFWLFQVDPPLHDSADRAPALPLPPFALHAPGARVAVPRLLRIDRTPPAVFRP